MPSLAREIVPIADAAYALRIDDVEVRPQALDPSNAAAREVERCLAGAVAYVEEVAGVPLLWRRRTFFVRRPVRATDPLIVPAIYLLGDDVPNDPNADPPTYHARPVEEIAYWPAEADPDAEPAIAKGDLRAEPNGQYDVENLGRIALVNRDCTGIWPEPGADEGWPEILPGSQFQVTVTQGWTTVDEIPGIDGIRRAIILQAGAIHDGITEDAHRDAVLSLLGPFRDARFL